MMVRLRLANDGDAGALMRLYHQLSKHYHDNPEAVAAALRHSSTEIYVAEDDDGGVVGTATVSFRVAPSLGLIAYVDDVVSDGTWRGRGIGSALMGHVIGVARARGCNHVELTSRPDRWEANRLYATLGFRKRNTNALCLILR